MSKADYYETLGVTRDVDDAELKRAYRKLAVKFHPDRNPDDPAAEERFKECSEAYQVLSDPEKRRTYDRFGHDGLSGGGYQGFSGFDDIFSSFGDVFSDLFGGGGGRRASRGADLRYDVELSFMDAVFGTKMELTFNRKEGCDTCEGTGVKPGTQPKTCQHCGGAGRITRQQGFFMVQTPCPACSGVGYIVEEYCDDCHGEGSVQVERNLTVTIPPGVDTGARMRVSGEGNAPAGRGARGDLYLFISVEEHELFQRDGADIYASHELSFSEAALGCDVEVETVHGVETVKVPAGTQPGTVVRLRRKGVKHVNRQAMGDHFLNLQVRVPTDLTKEQRAAVVALGEMEL